MKKWIVLILGVLCILLRSVGLADSFEITGIEYQGDGSTVITWSPYSGGGPYYVLVQHQPDGMVQIVDMLKKGEKCTTASLVPGETYLVTICAQSKYYTDDREITIPGSEYTDLSIQASFEPRRRDSKKLRTVKSFSADDILESLETIEFGGYLRLRHPQLKQNRTYPWTLAIRLPDQDLYVCYYKENDLLKGEKNKTQSVYYDLSEDFYYINLWKGFLPVGEYQLELYFGGQHVCNAPFEMTK